MKIKVDLIKEYIIDTINNNDESLETTKEKMQFFVERHEIGFIWNIFTLFVCFFDL